jgi:hypothetical protein
MGRAPVSPPAYSATSTTSTANSSSPALDHPVDKPVLERASAAAPARMCGGRTRTGSCCEPVLDDHDMSDPGELPGKEAESCRRGPLRLSSSSFRSFSSITACSSGVRLGGVSKSPRCSSAGKRPSSRLRFTRKLMLARAQPIKASRRRTDMPQAAGSTIRRLRPWLRHLQLAFRLGSLTTEPRHHQIPGTPSHRLPRTTRRLLPFGQ